MIKYYCDICDSEITRNVNVGGLDFNRGILQMCDSCYPKFKEAKASVYDEYKAKYEELDSDYKEDIKDYILTSNEDTEFTFENVNESEVQ